MEPWACMYAAILPCNPNPQKKLGALNYLFLVYTASEVDAEDHQSPTAGLADAA